ncbi:MAG: ABC transporter substrate-binding protein [Cellulomonas sp. 73-92]|uniref:sugar ABC transporter substrate-binding protein n=1 Tax=Cellulomonas sp. 73-92 TaxID=1895740 RepID=UPI000927049C|nr:extracellular solute-binding protein [Cellulomonas sp. 73-92]OJV80366.1 MAG: ABC transporter substrate-binding protein [Cellulomonas sp. 73-92]
MRAHLMARRLGGLTAGIAGLMALAACGSGFSGGGTSPTGTAGGTGGGSGSLTVLIGSSGDAETQAVTQAVSSWSATSGTPATVRPASNLNQELAQGFASGQPPDVFYVSADSFQGYAANGSLLAYGDKLGAVSDFYPSLVQQFTYKGKLYCAPKDFSTLALVINTDDWTAAGLTDADIPTTWDQLAADAKKLTGNGRVGLAFNGEYARIGVFLAQAGGTMVSADGKTATVDSSANVAALTYVQTHLKDGTFAYASTVGAGWGGEAFGTGKAAMTIEGNWITGAMTSNYPNVKYKVVPLPAGPGGKGTLQFTNCWGIAADSKNQDKAIDLVKYLTATDRQVGFAKAFGVMPSVQSAAAAYKSQFPELTAFIDSASFAQNTVTANGAAAVITDFNSKLEGLATGDPKAILSSVQTNLQAVLNQNQ